MAFGPAAALLSALNERSTPYGAADGGATLNSLGFPRHVGRGYCEIYVKTGSCPQPALCQNDHPEPDDLLQTSQVPAGVGGMNALQQAQMQQIQQMLGGGALNALQQAQLQQMLGLGGALALPAASAVARPAARPSLPAAQQVNSLGFPVRLDQDHCDFYLKTGTCKFGLQCKKNHPEPTDVVAMGAGSFEVNEVGLPRRPGAPNCGFYMKTGGCKFGSKCNYDHPDGMAGSLGDDCKMNSLGFPVRPGVERCPFYVKTGQCKFGVKCKNDHPEPGDLVKEQDPGSMLQQINDELAGGNSAMSDNQLMAVLAGQSMEMNSLGFPLRPNLENCDFYMRTGNCKYGNMCKKNHPEPADVIQLMETGANRAASVMPQMAGPKGVGKGKNIECNSLGFPLKPGAALCAFYMKSGTCSYGQTCKHHHPEPAEVVSMMSELSGETMNSAGLPIRTGMQPCGFYMKTGTCKFGKNCSFDHPENGACGAGGAPGASTANLNSLGFPVRPGQPHCPFYMKTGCCKFLASCKMHHPEPSEVAAMEAPQY